MRVRALLLGCFTVFLLNIWLVNNVHAQGFEQWVATDATLDQTILPSPGTVASAVNIPVDNFTLKTLPGNAMVVAVNLKQQDIDTNILWQDGSQTCLDNQRFESLVSYLEQNSLGVSMQLIYGDNAKTVTANFGGYNTVKNQLHMLLYNISGNVSADDVSSLTIKLQDIA